MFSWWGYESSTVGLRALPTSRTAPHHAVLKHPTENSRKGGTYSAVRSLEAIDLLFGTIELVLRSEGLQNLDNIVPDLLMVLVEQNNEASGLAVER